MSLGNWGGSKFPEFSNRCGTSKKLWIQEQKTLTGSLQWAPSIPGGDTFPAALELDARATWFDVFLGISPEPIVQKIPAWYQKMRLTEYYKTVFFNINVHDLDCAPHADLSFVWRLFTRF